MATKLKHPVQRELEIREAPGRAPRRWIITLDGEYLSYRRVGSREAYCIPHARALGVAVRDSLPR